MTEKQKALHANKIYMLARQLNAKIIVAQNENIDLDAHGVIHVLRVLAARIDSF